MKKNIEKELRFVLTDDQFEKFKEKARDNKSNIITGHSLRERTVMYDNPNPNMSFYSKEVDGRLRIRTSEPAKCEVFKESDSEPNVSMLTWKQRIPEYSGKELNQEYEIEAKIDSREMANLIHIFEKVLHCPRISSYERIRETFYMQGIEIASDTFPYGHVVELEIKNSTEKELYEVAYKLGLNGFAKSTRSCDDMYKDLCKLQNKTIKSDICFGDNEMPSLTESLEKGEV